ncbi:MAG: DUF3575 domain-containing protein [Flavobacteriaceae bacterium]|jgi:hypothetical protein|uniref:DUF3575 domain-containing protein n=1 Tax=Flavobacterium kayseriense TaxID=2764714 RepID=A0ABR7J4G2_9FLAO|nr:DUF3575 domain-containing protein [Flavobacterium kayseriense]MBC5840313.1 DUF3575 domain-containing protein [Flavobacterium kayseriense]MBC5847017.1 DUF3575 domain-containing protein [Flavobacterium kayseriense]MBX9888127.1 DUF3575 domain-containing protein [Flavobacteriaceae bacterium]
MKKLIIVIFFFSYLTTYSQEKTAPDFKKNELKGNALFLVLGAVEVSYERILNEDTGLGVTIFYVNEDDFESNFTLSPYYRAYFGKKTAAGFFIEGFSMFNTGVASKTYYYDNNNNISRIDKNRYTDLAIGFGLGSKWVHKKGYLFEINTGIGRNLLSKDSPEIVGRLGITLGYRF